MEKLDFDVWFSFDERCSPAVAFDRKEAEDISPVPLVRTHHRQDEGGGDGAGR
jgi:hypothetical protein